ncbi:hypothetical protein SRABI128_03978 [Microbacterium sp. Bi128]|nr:hypothetical protein SRABI128_03978 [Microbacterium sp. Bi128]
MRAIHGKLPYPTTMTRTATTESPIAIQGTRRRRSRNTVTPRSTVTMGLMKYPRLVSMT